MPTKCQVRAHAKLAQEGRRTRLIDVVAFVLLWAHIGYSLVWGEHFLDSSSVGGDAGLTVLIWLLIAVLPLGHVSARLMRENLLRDEGMRIGARLTQLKFRLLLLFIGATCCLGCAAAAQISRQNARI